MQCAKEFHRKKTMLKRINLFVFTRTKSAVLIAATLFAICMFFISHTEFNESIADILPVHDTLIQDQQDALKYFGQDKTLYFSISSNNADALADLAREFSQKLSALDELESEFHGAGNFDLEAAISAAIAYAPFIFDEADIAELRHEMEEEAIATRFGYLKNEIIKFGPQPYATVLTKDPFGVLTVLKKKLEKTLGTLDFAQNSSAIISPDGKSTLVIASFKTDSKDAQKSSVLVEKIRTLIENFEAENAGAKVAFAGAYRIASDNAKMAHADSSRCLAISILLMFTLCFFAFSRRVYAIFAMLPSILGTLAAFAIIGVAYPSVSAISIGFASIAIGVTIDYAIHFLFHSTAHADKNIGDFIHTAESLARPTLIGAITTIIAFGIMIFSGGKGFAQLGAFGAIGVAISAFLSLAILPAIAAKLKFKEPKTTFFDTLANTIEKRQKPKVFYALAILITLVSAVFALDISVDGKISSFSGLYADTQADTDAIKQTWNSAVSKSLAVARGKDFEDAIATNVILREKLANEPYVKNIDSLAPFLPTSEVRKKNLQAWRDMLEAETDLKSKIENSAKQHGFKTEAFASAFNALQPEIFEDAIKKLDSTPLAPLIKSKIKNDEHGVYISTLFNFNETHGLLRIAMRDRICADSDDIIIADNIMFETHVSKLASQWMLNFLVLAFALVSIYVMLAFRSFFKALLVILPVATGIFWTFGAMSFLGIPITLINAIFVIFAVCIAEDYAVFIIFERMNGKRSAALQSVIVASATTVVAFGILGFAQHPVLHGLGATAAISIFCILLSTILITLPLSKRLIPENAK